MKISIIIPTFNEVDNIEETLLPLQAWRQQGHEIILADGGSHDETIALAEPLVDQVVNSPKGRANQMNCGAKNTNGDVLLFLHADTRLPHNSPRLIRHALQQKQWGRFDVALTGQHRMFRVIEFMMNQRSRLTGIATGDQAIFVTRALFEKINGFAKIPLMEDIEFSKRLKKNGQPACVHNKLTTSSRRWEEYGIFKTILLMWRLRLAYFFGAKPEQLKKSYR
ncbi:TIGR04283 family arsenosugar biosynthesis glycosyltransferase [Pseudomonadota bacterium]